MNKVFPWISGLLGIAFGSLVLSAVGVLKPSQPNAIFALICVSIALGAWWVVYLRFRKNIQEPLKDIPEPLEKGDKPEFILWRDGLYQRTGECVNKPTSKTEEQGEKQ